MTDKTKFHFFFPKKLINEDCFIPVFFPVEGLVTFGGATCFLGFACLVIGFTFLVIRYPSSSFSVINSSCSPAGVSSCSFCSSSSYSSSLTKSPGSFSGLASLLCCSSFGDSGKISFLSSSFGSSVSLTSFSGDSSSSLKVKSSPSNIL